MQTTSVARIFFLAQTMHSYVLALTQFPDQKMSRYEHGVDYTTVSTWDDADQFCRNKGLMLPTRNQICPDGVGKAPIGGNFEGDNWVSVIDDLEVSVQVGSVYLSCEGHREVNIRRHDNDVGRNSWGKEPYHNNQVYCVGDTTPTPVPTLSVADAAGDGCQNHVKFSSNFVSSSGEVCDTCSFCDGSRLSAVFDPDSQGACIDCAGTDNSCVEIQIMTTFDNEWAMEFISLSSSHAGSEYDPETIIIEGSNDDDVWDQLLQKTLVFNDRKEAVDFLIDDSDKKHKHYKMTFRMKESASKMHIGHYAIISSYTKTCTSNIFEDVTGISVMPYKIQT